MFSLPKDNLVENKMKILLERLKYTKTISRIL